MKHVMNLQPRYFDFIKDGTKRIELRLFDEKRQKIGLGDTIEFVKSENEKIETKVIGLLRYRTFEELFRDFDMSILADKSVTRQELFDALNQFYPLEKQEKYGVVGIRIELV